MKKKLAGVASVAFAAVLACSACGTPSGGDGNPEPGASVAESNTWYIHYNTSSQADMEIDFSARDGSLSQNVKKVDMFSPTWNFLKGNGLDYASLDSLKYMSELKSEAMRVDLMFGNGGIGQNDLTQAGILNTPDAWSKVDTLTEGLNKAGAIPYYIMVGIPKFAQGEKETPKSVPNAEKYTEFCINTAKYFKDTKQRLIYETWNEPDLNATSYWTDGMRPFIDTSIMQATALKKGDPDAYVAELGLCWPINFCEGVAGNTLWDYYMEETEKAGNHIDAFTWHYYGDDYGDMEECAAHDNFSRYKKAVRDSINRDNEKYDLYTMTQHCTEFSPAATGAGIVVQDGLIPKLYKALGYVQDSTDISRFSWASYLMSEFYLINPYSWQKMPVFYVLWSYGRLPLAPATVTAGDGVEENFGYMTGVDDKRAGAIIYNKTLNPSYSVKKEYYIQREQDSREISVKLKNVPFTAKNAKVYLIDNEHVSYNAANDKPYLIMDLEEDKIQNGDVVLDLKIPGNAAMYIELDDGDGQSVLDTKSNLKEHIVRKDYYYEERADRTPYADIYENGFDISLGMWDNESGKTALMVTLDDMAQFNSLGIDYNIYGAKTGAGSDKALGVRVDYHTVGGYTSSASYYWRNYGGGFTYRGWGTGEAVQGRTFPVQGDKGTFDFPLATNAPAGWDGRIQITYFMADCGKEASAVFKTVGKN